MEWQKEKRHRASRACPYSTEFIRGQLHEAESVIKMCEAEHFSVNGRRSKKKDPNFLDNQLENYIAGRQKAYTSMIRFLRNKIREYKSNLGVRNALSPMSQVGQTQEEDPQANPEKGEVPSK